MLVSIIWLLSFLVDAVLIAFLFEKRTVASAFVPGVMLVVAFDCVLYGVSSMVGLSVHLELITIVQMLLLFVLVRVCNGVHPRPAKQLIDAIDLVALLVLGAIVFLCAFKQFGPSFQIHYTASDPSRHIFETWKIVDGGMVSGQFAWWSFTAMLSQALSGLSIEAPLYKVFILTDIISLYFSGLLLYAVIKNTASRSTRVLGVLISALYVICYPLSVMVYGFCYLGAGVNFLALILFAIVGTDCKAKRYLAASLGALGVVTSYSLFAPPVFLALFVYIAYSEWKEARSVKRLMFVEVSFFAIPVLIGFFIVFLGIFSNLSVSDALATEGGIYKNLFIDFVFCAPFAILGFCVAVKRSRWSFSVIHAVVFLVYAAVALLLGLMGWISSYYFYKMHFALWLIFFVFAAGGLYRILKLDTQVAICMMAPWIAVATMCMTGFDASASRVAPIFNPTPGSDVLMPLATFNRTQVAATQPYSMDKIDLFERFDKALSDNDVHSFAVLGTYVDIYWFEPIAVRGATDSYYWNLDDGDLNEVYSSSEFILMLNEPDPSADGGSLTTLSGSSPYRLFEAHLDEFETMYENAAGKVLQRVR